jgi:hypothetical protein
MDAEASPLPLADQYAAAVAAVEAAQAGKDCGPAALARALAALASVEAAAERAALFSANEDADDVATSSLKYLMLPLMRADLLSGAPAGAGGARQRATHVAAALGALRQGLLRTARLGILKGAAAQAAGLGGDDRDDDEEGEDDGEELGKRGARGASNSRALTTASAAAAAADPGARRLAKIERFKRSRALAAAVDQLRRQREAARGGGGNGGGADGDEAGGGGGGRGPTGGPGGWDEEDERRLWLLRVEGAALSALDTRDMLLQEAALLRHAVDDQERGEAEGLARRESGRGASTSGSGGGGGGPMNAARDARMRPGARRPGGSSGGGGSGSSGYVIEGDGQASRAAMMTRLSGIAEALTINDKARWQQQVRRGAWG